VGYTWVAILQYALLMCILVVVSDTMWMIHAYHWFGLTLSHKAITLSKSVLKPLKMISNLWAMFNMVILFEYLCESKETHERMAKINPMSKLFCIKLLVMFSLWQEVVFKLLAGLDMLPVLRGNHVEWWKSQEKNAEAAINFCVCLECLLFSQWHRYAYPYDEDWTLESNEALGKLEVSDLVSTLRKFNVFTMFSDVKILLRDRARGQRRAIKTIQRHKRLGSLLDANNDHALNQDFKCFELDENEEAPIEQLAFVLVSTKIAKNHAEARQLLESIDVNKNERISFKEFTQLCMRANSADNVPCDVHWWNI